MKNLKQIIRFIANHPLAGKHKLKAFYRFISWQLSQFLFRHERIVPFVGDTKLLAKKGLTGATGNIYTGLEEFSDMGFLLHFLRKEDLFADIGANVGSYSILASGYAGARSISYEPVPSTFSWLKKNIQLNDLNDLITEENIAIGSKKTEVYFSTTQGTVNHVLSESEINQQLDRVAVQVYSFDEIISGGKAPQLIKIDVEGFETEVIKGMKQTLQLADVKAIIIELNGSGGRYGFDESLIHQNLVDFRFLPYHYDPYTRQLKRLENYGSTNTIYIRDLEFVTQRVQSAKKVNVFSEEF
ncbi:FkbM family methyltransferase [Lacibacter sp. H375]|uniref:FkbM family methyltransferase n=1 Tax=Lacibacter sp. H375 TaxID=3133424 RepID=UPI0030BF49D9